MPSTTIDDKLAPVGKLHVYTAPDVPIHVLNMAVEQLCVAFVQAHSWHWTCEEVCYRVTDADQIGANRRFELWTYFAVKILGLRVDNGPHGGDVRLAIGDDCVAAGLLIKHHELSYVEPDYHERDATSPRQRSKH